MKANEIRIGNIFLHTNENGTFSIVVKEILDGGVNTRFNNGTWFIGLDNIRPIPLTEEILLKAGFEKDIESLFYRNSFIIAKTKTRWAFYHNGLTGGELARIDYIHELQNLIFALTGEEIKIEL